MLEVLMYLFEHHMQAGRPFSIEEPKLMHELEGEGFSSSTIKNALTWLQGLESFQLEQGKMTIPSQHSHRVYTTEEMVRMDIESRNFINRLEERAVLNAQTREWVIDRVLSLNNDFIQLFHVKWVCLLVLYRVHGEEAVLTCVDTLELNEAEREPETIH